MFSELRLKAMTKYFSSTLLSVLFLLNSCQSVEQFSIDYMLPAEISFPTTLKRVAIVNNMPETPDNKLIINEKSNKKEESEIARRTNYYNGDARITTEVLAETLADGNYFDEVVICDSALRSKDINPRESTLSTEEVNTLVQELDVDCLIALENIQLHSTRKTSYLRDWGAFYGTVDVKAYPTVKIYLPNRKGPMVTVNGNDSIFWEEIGSGEATVRARLINEEELIKQASEFAGTIPAKHLLPHWTTASRYLFQGGSVNMRDAAVYAKEGNWPDAISLWKANFEAKKRKQKQKMYAAYNIAVGYEMQDSIDNAVEWALKAQQIARETSKADKKEMGAISDKTISYYFLFSLYAEELQKRKEGLSRLHIQMNRFDE